MMATHSQRGVPRSGSVSASQVALDSTEAVSVRSDPLIVPNYSMVAKDLSLWYGKFQALKNVSVPMREGIITGLIVPSGGGKTTLLRCLNRIKERCGNVTEIARKGPQARQPILKNPGKNAFLPRKTRRQSGR